MEEIWIIINLLKKAHLKRREYRREDELRRAASEYLNALFSVPDQILAEKLRKYG